MKKVEKQNNPNYMNLFWCKANVKGFGFNDLHQDFDITRIVFLMMLDFFLKRQEKASRLLKKYAEFSYTQIVLKSSMLVIV